jgi:segregation and condensation protein B
MSQQDKIHGEAALEAIIFASPEPLPLKEIMRVLEMNEGEARELIDSLMTKYHEEERGLELRLIAGGYQLCTKAKYASYIEGLFIPTRPPQLSHAALETLAIVAFKEPVTKAEIEEIRGVRVDSVLTNLQDRGLIEEVGRRETIGRPVLYGTTSEFLKYFGLKDIQELTERYPLEAYKDEGVVD